LAFSTDIKSESKSLIYAPNAAASRKCLEKSPEDVSPSNEIAAYSLTKQISHPNIERFRSRQKALSFTSLRTQVGISSPSKRSLVFKQVMIVFKPFQKAIVCQQTILFETLPS
jgi:hypothetical protein